MTDAGTVAGAGAGAGGDLNAWLARHGLTEYRVALCDQLGAKFMSDMLELNEEDIAELGLKKLDERRLRKALTALRNGFA